ncbi:hypothetical protein [Dyadobacter chenwenxiniae]|uniref:hypothetical protein n=1 Tax=Dyadobacter chenwenxiniae TaxID=2906456 RepID=UPI001F2E6598|nr:hypothetical protein [Dyadobacter chenwenxiniae]
MMRIIIQAIMTKEPYRTAWNAWSAENIIPADQDLSIKSMIVLLLVMARLVKRNDIPAHDEAM